jgi:hypothetical protein
MHIKNIEILSSRLDEENGEIIAKISLHIEVEDQSRTSYIIEQNISTPPVTTWETLTAQDKEKQIKQSLKGRTY